MKKFFIGFLSGAIIFGTIGVFAASYVANPADFKVMVNGTEFNSDPPALVVEGRTYLPLRAIGDALGVPVNWNESLRQAEVGMVSESSEEVYQNVEFYYNNPSIPSYRSVTDISNEFETSDDNGIILFYSYEFVEDVMRKIADDFDKYKAALDAKGFVLTSDQNLIFTYTNSEKNTSVSFYQGEKDGVIGCYVMYKASTN